MFWALGIVAVIAFVMGMNGKGQVEARPWVVGALTGFTAMLYTLVAVVGFHRDSLVSAVEGVLWGVIIFIAPLAGLLYRHRATSKL